MYSVLKESPQKEKPCKLSQKANWSSNDGYDSSKQLTLIEVLKGAVHGSKVIPEET